MKYKYLGILSVIAFAFSLASSADDFATRQELNSAIGPNSTLSLHQDIYVSRRDTASFGSCHFIPYDISGTVYARNWLHQPNKMGIADILVSGDPVDPSKNVTDLDLSLSNVQTNSQSNDLTVTCEFPGHSVTPSQLEHALSEEFDVNFVK